MIERIHHLQKLLQEQSLDGVLITSLPNIIYFTNYQGFVPDEREAYILVTKTDAYLFTNALYIGEMKTIVPQLTLIEIQRNNFLTKTLSELIKRHKLTTIGIEEDNLTAKEYKNILKLPITMSAIDLSNLRVLKTQNEIALIQKACEIGDHVYSQILKNIRVGITEKELANQIELFIKQSGADSSFRAIVAFGKNAAIPHHLSDETKLKKNMCVLMDFGAKVDGYCSDMTRTFFFGKATERQKHVYQTVLTAQMKAIDLIKTKLKKKEAITETSVDKIAREYIINQGFDEFPHRLGHGIGLEVHEAPHLFPFGKDHLQEDMVFSIEPGIYLPIDLGVRIEDLYTIKQNKLITLTKAPSELLEI